MIQADHARVPTLLAFLSRHAAISRFTGQHAERSADSSNAAPTTAPTTGQWNVSDDTSRRVLPPLTLQNLLWAILVLAAVVTRFWDLGYRTVHHDESLHVYYSWLFAQDGTYSHNPLMHGPFLFHGNALIYAIFGASDATSRFLPALFGVLLVWMPWLLRGRRFLGPWGALAVGYMLLISPAFLYYTRYIRHDPYTAAGALLLAIAVFRYLERPQRRWMITAFVTVAFLLTNHEIVFAIALAMVMVLWISLLLTHLRPLIPVHICAVLLAGIAFLGLRHREEWVRIPWDIANDLTQRQFYASFLGHPFMVGLILLTTTYLGLTALFAALAPPRRHAILVHVAGTASILALLVLLVDAGMIGNLKTYAGPGTGSWLVALGHPTLVLALLVAVLSFISMQVVSGSEEEAPFGPNQRLVLGLSVLCVGLVALLMRSDTLWPDMLWYRSDEWHLDFRQPGQPPESYEQLQYVYDLFDRYPYAHAIVGALLVIGVAFLFACAIVIARMVRRSPHPASPMAALFGDARSNTVAYGVYHALRDPVGIVIGASLAFLFFIVLFTTFFTNPRGFATATYAPDGTLLYWLGQQEVQRGQQPWFYFITEGFQYEWLGIFFAIVGLAVTAVRAIRGFLGYDAGPNLLFNIFNAWWFVFMFLVLSWAGEKMPWLILHIALPGFLVAGSLINEVVEGAVAWFRSHPSRHPVTARYGMLGMLVVLIALAISWFFLAARRTYGQWVETGPNVFERVIPQGALNDWWHLALPPLAGLIIIAAAVWLIGPRKTAYTVITTAFIVLSLFQIHQGFRVTYLEGDVAIDTLIYNTTSPDVTDLTADLEQMSMAVYGNNGMRVQFDGCVQWPFNWYLRDFPNRSLSTIIPADPATGPEVIIGHTDPDGCSYLAVDEIPGYTAQTYVLRWHEPEQQVYREFAIAPEIPAGRSAWMSPEQPHGPVDIARSIWSSFQQAATPEGQQRLFRLLMYREMPTELTTYEFKVFVRNDMLPYYNDARYGE